MASILSLAVLLAAISCFAYGVWDSALQWGLLLKWKCRARAARLPRGNWWFPWIGESLQFFLKSPDDFFRDRFSRYGSIFVTHIFGSTTIMTSSPEEARFILGTRHKQFRARYPESIDRVLNHPFWEGEFHQRVRKIVQTPMMPEVLSRPQVVATFDNLAQWVLSSWSPGGAVVTHAETRKFSFHVALHLVCSLPPSPETMKMLDDYECVARGAICFPLNVPGTGFHLALKKSRVILQALERLVDERRRSPDKQSDILGSLLDDPNMSVEQVRNILMTLLFAGHETTGVLLVWIVKFLTENPRALALVREEQEAVRDAKQQQGQGGQQSLLTWEDVKRMPYTTKVVQETLRLANVAPFSPREILEDVEYNGKLFPKGWRVQVYYRHFHLNAEYHNRPFEFDPSRFETPPKPSTYTPFGNGIRLCPGSELVKLEVLIFIHRLVTMYSWEAVGRDKGIQYWPTPRPRGGYPIKVQHHDQTE